MTSPKPTVDVVVLTMNDRPAAFLEDALAVGLALLALMWL